MSKIFIDSTIWDDIEFQEMESKYKLFWFFILSKSNCAGIWKPNIRLLSFQTGEEFNSLELLKIFKNHLTILENGSWLINKYVKFQCGELSIKCPAHKPVIKELQKHKNIPIIKQMLLSTCSPNSLSDSLPNSLYNRQQEKEKEKEKEKDRENAKRERIKTPTIEQIYLEYPRKIGKAAAIKSIEKAIEKIKPNELLEIVKTYSKKIAWKEKQFIPMPATWFNGERWLDDQSEWEEPTQNKISYAKANHKKRDILDDFKGLTDEEIMGGVL